MAKDWQQEQCIGNNWENIGNRNNALVTIGKSLVEKVIFENYDLPKQCFLNALVKDQQ